MEGDKMEDGEKKFLEWQLEDFKYRARTDFRALAALTIGSLFLVAVLLSLIRCG